MDVFVWRTVSAPARGLFWCLLPELRSNDGNKHQNNTRVSAETFRQESTYIMLILTRHNESINDDIKTTIFTRRPRVSLARFPFYWWRHKRSLMTSHWPDNCDAVTWIVITNSLDINFVHGDIHGLSCKNTPYPQDKQRNLEDNIKSAKWRKLNHACLFLLSTMSLGFAYNYHRLMM